MFFPSVFLLGFSFTGNSCVEGDSLSFHAVCEAAGNADVPAEIYSTV